MVSATQVRMELEKTGVVDLLDTVGGVILGVCSRAGRVLVK
jgi:hypothetical protein